MSHVGRLREGPTLGLVAVVAFQTGVSGSGCSYTVRGREDRPYWREPRCDVSAPTRYAIDAVGMWTVRIVGVAAALGAFGCGEADGKDVCVREGWGLAQLTGGVGLFFASYLFEDARSVARRRMRTCSEDVELYWDWRQLEQ
jgi:hypothetical protein